MLSLKKQVTIKVANSNTYPVDVNLKGAYTQKGKTPATLLQRTNLSKAVAGNRAFIGLGHHTSDGTTYSDFYEYNADNDQWTQLADFPGTIRRYPVAFALGDYVYVGMGFEPTTYDRLADMWRYNITTGTWQQIQDFPGTPKYDPFVFVKDNKAYIGGGNSASLTPTLELWSFDGSVWQQKNNLPEYNNGPSKCFIDNHAVYIYLLCQEALSLRGINRQLVAGRQFSFSPTDYYFYGRYDRWQRVSLDILIHKLYNTEV